MDDSFDDDWGEDWGDDDFSPLNPADPDAHPFGAGGRDDTMPTPRSSRKKKSHHASSSGGDDSGQSSKATRRNVVLVALVMALVTAAYMIDYDWLRGLGEVELFSSPPPAPRKALVGEPPYAEGGGSEKDGEEEQEDTNAEVVFYKERKGIVEDTGGGEEDATKTPEEDATTTREENEPPPPPPPHTKERIIEDAGVENGEAQEEGTENSNEGLGGVKSLGIEVQKGEEEKEEGAGPEGGGYDTQEPGALPTTDTAADEAAVDKGKTEDEEEEIMSDGPNGGGNVEEEEEAMKGNEEGEVTSNSETKAQDGKEEEVVVEEVEKKESEANSDSKAEEEDGVDEMDKADEESEPESDSKKEEEKEEGERLGKDDAEQMEESKDEQESVSDSKESEAEGKKNEEGEEEGEEGEEKQAKPPSDTEAEEGSAKGAEEESEVENKEKENVNVSESSSELGKEASSEVEHKDDVTEKETSDESNTASVLSDEQTTAGVEEKEGEEEVKEATTSTAKDIDDGKSGAAVPALNSQEKTYLRRHYDDEDPPQVETGHKDGGGDDSESPSELESEASPPTATSTADGGAVVEEESIERKIYYPANFSCPPLLSPQAARDLLDTVSTTWEASREADDDDYMRGEAVVPTEEEEAEMFLEFARVRAVHGGDRGVVLAVVEPNFFHFVHPFLSNLRALGYCNVVYLAPRQQHCSFVNQVAGETICTSLNYARSFTTDHRSELLWTQRIWAAKTLVAAGVTTLVSDQDVRWQLDPYPLLSMKPFSGSSSSSSGEEETEEGADSAGVDVQSATRVDMVVIGSGQVGKMNGGLWWAHGGSRAAGNMLTLAVDLMVETRKNTLAYIDTFCGPELQRLLAFEEKKSVKDLYPMISFDQDVLQTALLSSALGEESASYTCRKLNETMHQRHAAEVEGIEINDWRLHFESELKEAEGLMFEEKFEWSGGEEHTVRLVDMYDIARGGEKRKPEAKPIARYAISPTFLFSFGKRVEQNCQSTATQFPTAVTHCVGKRDECLALEAEEEVMVRFYEEQQAMMVDNEKKEGEGATTSSWTDGCLEKTAAATRD